MISNRKSLQTKELCLKVIYMDVTIKRKRSHEFEREEEGYTEELERKERKGRHAVIIIKLSQKRPFMKIVHTLLAMFYIFWRKNLYF